MGRGRAPCCDKSKVKKGPWSPAEDFRLISFIQSHGHGNWRALPKQAGLLRCGKSCRLRWINYLRPDVKRGNFSPEEEETIITLHKSMGNKWSKIASHLPGRTDNEIKNVWNTHLKKKLGRGRADPPNHQNECKDSSASHNASPSSSASSCISYGDLNSDKGPAARDQEGHESAAVPGKTNDQKQDSSPAVALEKCKPIDEPKEAWISPTHSNASNFQTLGSVESQVKDDDSLLHCMGPSSEVQNSNTSESTKENFSGEVIEIPLESDIDFWNMFDSFDNPLQHSSSESQPQECEIAHSSNFEVDLEGDVDYKKWLRYLENELGLVGGSTHSDHPRKGADDQQLEIETSDNEMKMLRPEIDPAITYFSMWPSSPQDFGI